jgi:serine phosphatase RsbU (regulator of sigma subunit)
MWCSRHESMAMPGGTGSLRCCRKNSGGGPAIRSRTGLILLLPLPFLITAGAVVGRLTAGPSWGLLPLMVLGPAVAAAIGGVTYILAAGATAEAGCMFFNIRFMHEHVDRHAILVAFLVTLAVTGVGVAAARIQRRRAQELKQVRIVAESVQQVLLRPVPSQVGSLRMAVRYLSAASEARVGGDLYEVAATGHGLRLIIGDVEGKGLPAVQSAATVLGAFREAAHTEECLSAVVARIEDSLARDVDDDQFVTAVLAEISADESKVELISCGHPEPLLIWADGRRFVDSGGGSLPLGLTDLGATPRIPVTIPFEPGNEILFYTDGASEARNKAGEFFPLAQCGSLEGPADPAAQVDRLSDEVVRYVGHEPEDDVALMLVYRESALQRLTLAPAGR